MVNIEKQNLKAETKNLNFFYDSFQALKKVSIPIAMHSVTALIGPSGCGKTTFLRCFNRMHDLYPNNRYDGEIILYPDCINVVSSSIDPIEIRMRLGMVFQKPNPFPKSIYDNVVYGLEVRGVKDRTILNEKVKESLKRAALWDEVKDRLKEHALNLSGGQQQRLCIARALATDPELLLLDEPCSALDPISTAKVEELLHELKRFYTIVIVTHNLQQAARVADYTAFFLLGEMVEFGPSDKIFTAPKDKRTEDYITGRFG